MATCPQKLIGTGSTLNFDQLKALWISNGGNPNVAPVMAAIAIAESGGRTNVLNDCPQTGDYSVGLFQINYAGSLRPGRSQSYGTPEQLAADPNRQAKAAIALSGNGANLSPWTTYTSGAYKAPLKAGGGTLGALPSIAALPPLTTQANPAAGAAGPADLEGALVDLTMPGSIPNIRISRAVARKILGATVMVGGALVGLAGVFLLTGGKAPGPAGVVQGVLADRKRGRDEEAMVTSKAQSRRTAVDQAETDRRAAANRKEAAQAVAERKRQNRDAQRQEDALQRIEARRTATASNRRTTASGGSGPGRAAQSKSRSARAAGERAADKAGAF